LSVLSIPGALAAPPPGVTFTKVADKNTIIPAGQYAGQKFATVSTVYERPGIDRGNVVFTGGPTGTNVPGAYYWENGVLGLVADHSTPVVGGGTPSGAFWSPSVHDGSYAFEADRQVYWSSGGKLRRVGSPGGIWPALGEQVWYVTTAPHPPPPSGPTSTFLNRADGASTEIVVPSGQPAPSGPEGLLFRVFERTVAHDDKAVFYATSGTLSRALHGLYQWSDGEVTRIVDTSMPPFDRIGRYDSFDLDGENVAFLAGSYPRTIYSARQGSIEVVAIQDQPAPGGGVLGFPTDVWTGISVDHGHIAFTSGPEPYKQAIYTDVSGSLQRVVGPGDLLFGEIVASVLMGSAALSDNQIVFRANLTNGNYGVFIATVPEPSTAAVLLLSAWLGMWRRRA
jgi:hypothetical protein